MPPVANGDPSLDLATRRLDAGIRSLHPLVLACLARDFKFRLQVLQVSPALNWGRVGPSQLKKTSATQRVEPGSADEAIPPRAAEQAVATELAEQGISPSATVDAVRAASGTDDVVAAATADQIRPGASRDHVATTIT